MPSLLARIVARVTALLPEDWVGRAGRQFRGTVANVAGTEKLGELAAEGVRRLAVGAVSREHSEALKNYADEEEARAAAELTRRTLNARQRQEDARADQEQIRTRILRTEELMGRLRLFDELRLRDAVPVWDSHGNMTIVRVQSGFDWDAARDRLFTQTDMRLLAGPSDE
jgi:hypothetical protein